MSDSSIPSSSQPDFDQRATTHHHAHPSAPPTTASLAPLPRSGTGVKVAAAIGILVGGLGLTGGILFAARRLASPDTAEAVVRVATRAGHGSGFFVAGPDELTYVATAFHVIEDGEPILVERVVQSADGPYVEAYPESKVVAYDADSDLAIIRIENVRGDRFSRLPLAERPTANEAVRSYGFPSSSITKRSGLIVSDGKLLSLVKFPIVDQRAKRVVRDNAVDGVLVSTDLEPGFSGGPTVNDDGEVVGINVQKDLAHDGQNGVVHVKVLAALLERVEPARAQRSPSEDDIADMLVRIQKELLRLPLDARARAREHEIVSAAEMPRLRELIAELRRHERDSVQAPGDKLSGRAALGVWAAQFPGRPLETYLSPAVQEALTRCQRDNQRLVSLFRDAAGDDSAKRQDAASTRACDELALRPLAWDLLAATLQWTGSERQIIVTKVERADEEADLYRIMVQMSGLDSLVPLWVTTEYGQLRVKLFDADGRLYGVRSAASPSAGDLAGEWQLAEARAPSSSVKDAELERLETVSVQISGGGDVTVKHTVSEHLFATDGALFRCSGSAESETGWIQSFAGKLEHGAVVAVPTAEARPHGADAGYCNWGYQPDQVAVFKLLDGELVMYRSDGRAYPQSVVLERPKKAEQ